MHHKRTRLLLLFLYFFTVISVVATVRANAASFQLTWVDNSQNEDGFHVERKQGTNGTFSLLATVGPNVTSYSDGNLAASTTYCYRLNAFNSTGNSAYTNEACETTPATFDFSLSNGGNKSVTQGQSITNTITATLTAGSPQGVSFSTPGLLPSGATASYTTSTSCNPTCSRTLNIATAASTPAGTYTIMVTGTSGGLTRTTNFTLTVNSPTPTFDFSLTHGGNKSATQGQSVTNIVTATLSSGSSQSVSFSTSGLPTGATASYTTSNSCTPTCSRTLNIATAASTPTGTHTITVTGSGGGVTKTTNFTLTVNAPAGNPPPATYTLTPTPTTVQPGGTITVSWTAPSGSSTKDWIALYASGAANTAYGWWQYTNGATSGSFTVPAPSVAGSYEFRYLLNDGFTSVKQSNTITVTANPPSGTTYTLTATPGTVQRGGTITISWTAPSGSSSKDWIGLYATGAANTAYGWWQYTNGATNGSFTVPAPSASGTYEFRYLLNDGFNSVKQSNTINVTGSTS